MKTSKIIIIILIILAFAGGIYFKDDAIRLYNNFIHGLDDFKKTEVGSFLSQVGKEILTPPPLNIGGINNQVTLLKSKILLQTNLQRQQNGNLPALKENLILNQAAAAKASDMFKNQYFEHVSPTGVDPGKLVQSFGYSYILAGENLILGNFKDEQELVQKWMDSPGHRANILNNRYTDIGVAVIKGTYKGDTVWIGVQEFGVPLSKCSSPEEDLKNIIELNKSQLDALSSEIDAKRAEIENTNPKAAYYSELVDNYNQRVNQYNVLSEDTKVLISRYNNQVNTFNDCVAGK